MSDRYDILVVGAGYAGSVVAERMAAVGRQRILVIDRRDHIAGNAYDYYDEHGVLCHRYGPHIFHTKSEKVVEYLSRFTDWRSYEHRVLARVDGRLVPMPINRTTVNELYGLGLTTEEDMERFLESRAEAADYIRTSEDVVVAKVGRELPRLHAQAVAARPVRAALLRVRADSDSHQRGRPLLHRQLPEDSGRRLHGDVRADPRPPHDRRQAGDGLLGREGRDRVRAARLHRPDRRVLRPPVRRAPVPVARVGAAHGTDPRRRLPPAGGVDKRTESRRAIHPDHRVPAHHRADPARPHHSRGRVPARRGRPLLPDPE